MIISTNTSVNDKLSWFKSDISSISSLDGFPYFSLIKIVNALLVNGYILFLIGLRFYILRHGTFLSEQSRSIDEILSFNPQKAILIGTTIGLFSSLLLIGSLIKSCFSTKLSYVKIPEIVRKNKDLSLVYAALKAPEIVPKGFDLLLSTALGTFGILLFIFLLLINQENNSFFNWLAFLVTYSTIFYCIMKSVFIAFNSYSIINSAVLFAIILLPPYFFNMKLISESYESVVIFWLPIITIYLLPLLKRGSKVRKGVGFVDRRRG